MLLSRQHAVLLTGLLFGATSCRKAPTAEECGALLDQYVQLLVKSDRAITSEAEVLKLQAQAREKAARDPAFQRCSEELSRAELECALRADTADRFEQCLL